MTSDKSSAFLNEDFDDCHDRNTTNNYYINQKKDPLYNEFLEQFEFYK